MIFQDFNLLNQKNVYENIEFPLTFPETTAKYLKVVAGCLEALPEWHSGKGRPGFVFVDEIIVK